jgi:DNA-binding NtrC family response regulator
MEKFVIYIVEDDAWYRELLEYTISLDPDHTVASFATAADFLRVLHNRPDVVTLDYYLPDMDGASLLMRIKEASPDTEVIIISEQENIQVAVDLLKTGAYDYLVKTKDIKNRLLNTVRNIREKTSLRKRIDHLQDQVTRKYSFSNTIIGTSKSTRKVYELIEKAASTNITVVISGETGTGKELAAKAIHFNSKRKSQPFVPVNVAAIPSELIESELFGHEKGAFTGANFRRIGKFEEAGGGTLFLDEIGEMDFNLQAKLLRVLQEKEITRIGSNQMIKTNCRIVAATNKDLLQEVKQGRFREDLYFRLYGINIHMPPLQERGEDIILLAKYFIREFCAENDMEMPTLATDAQNKLLQYRYPGNIRELKSVVELAVVMSNDGAITSDEINFRRNEELYEPPTAGMTLKQHTERIIRLYLQKHNDNVKAAADELDISYSTIYRMLNKDG